MVKNKLHKRIFELALKYELTHIGSAISCVDIIDEIYNIKKSGEPFFLGNSHAFLALAVILEKFEKKNAEQLIKENGTHANRNLKNGIYCSGGSLGSVEAIALGCAMTTKTNVYLLSSDGGMMNEIPWSVLRVKADKNISNLKWYINANGFGAYNTINTNDLSHRIYSFCPDIKVIKTHFHDYKFLNGIDAHYTKVTEKDLENA